MPDTNASLHGWNSIPTGPLAAGPLIGQVTPDGARIWVQARDTQPLTVSVYARDAGAAAAPLFTDQQQPDEDAWLCCVFDVHDLDPGREYAYAFSSPHGQTDRVPLRLGLQADATRLRIAFGSCYKDYANRDLRIFDAIVRAAPDLFLMLGDTCYSDEDDRKSEATFMQAHLRNRNNDALRRLIATVPTLGIWDDHDFGPNDADSGYSEKDRSLRCFRRMWAQTSYGTPDCPGIFSRVRCGPVDLFLLDSRSQRRTRRQVLGDAQLQWLFAELRASSAPIKLLLSGSQLLPEVAALPDWNWECFRRDGAEELAALQGHLAAADIHGVIALSGDPHLGQLFYSPGVQRRDGRCGPPLWELTSSPLANRPWSRPVWPADSHGDYAFDRYLLEEVAAVNFGTVDIDLERAGAEVRLALHQDDGTPWFSYDLDLARLATQPTKTPPHVCVAVRDGHHAYAFVGDKYARYDLKAGRVDAGFPRPIQAGWKGVFSDRLSTISGLDAVYFSRRGKAYFFCGNGYVRFDLERDHADAGYPRYIKTHWPGVWSHGLVAVLPISDDKVYFISDSACIRYDLHADRAEPGYPRPLADEFAGLPLDLGPIQAAIAWHDGSYFFVCGDLVYRYDPSTHAPSPGYPRRLTADLATHPFGFLD